MGEADKLFSEGLASGRGIALERVVFRHPFGDDVFEGGRVACALERLADPLDHIEATGRFESESISAQAWQASFGGRALRGVTAVTLREDACTLDVMVGPVPSAEGWRDEFVARPDCEMSKDSLRPLPIPGQSVMRPDAALDAKLPFEVTDDVVFHSPVLARPVVGKEAVTQVIAHASSIYGEREYGPKIMGAGELLSFWSGTVLGHRLEVANVIRFAPDRRVREMFMAMRPWPVLKLFHEVAKAQTEHFMDPSFFAASPA